MRKHKPGTKWQQGQLIFWELLVVGKQSWENVGCKKEVMLGQRHQAKGGDSKRRKNWRQKQHGHVLV